MDKIRTRLAYACVFMFLGAFAIGWYGYFYMPFKSLFLSGIIWSGLGGVVGFGLGYLIGTLTTMGAYPPGEPPPPKDPPGTIKK